MGMEASIKVTVTLNSGRKLVNDCVCYWRRGWNIAGKIFEILGKKPDENTEYTKINRGDLQEIKEFLLNCCVDMETIEKYDYWSDAGKFINSCFNNAAEIHKIQLLRDKKLPLYEVFPNECEDNYDPNDNIIDVLVEFEYSP